MLLINNTIIKVPNICNYNIVIGVIIFSHWLHAAVITELTSC